jgi:hypothetical protein
MGDRMIQLLITHLRVNRVCVNDKQKRISTLDSCVDFFPPACCKGNIFPINLGIVLACSECLMRDFYKVLVLAGIGDEDITHQY